MLAYYNTSQTKNIIDFFQHLSRLTTAEICSFSRKPHDTVAVLKDPLAAAVDGKAK